MEIMQKLLGIVAMTLSGLSLLFNIIAIAIPSWVSSFGFNSGLWKRCANAGSFAVCLTLPADDNIRATRAMEILGMLLIIGAIACGALKLFFMTEQVRLPKIAGAVAIAAGLMDLVLVCICKGVLMLIGVIIYGAKFEEAMSAVRGLTIVKPTLAAGFGLAIVAALFAIAAGILFYVADSKKQI